MANERYLKPDDQSGEKTPSGTAALLDLSEIPLSSPLSDDPDSLLPERWRWQAAVRSAAMCRLCFAPHFSCTEVDPSPLIADMDVPARGDWLAAIFRDSNLRRFFRVRQEADLMPLSAIGCFGNPKQLYTCRIADIAEPEPPLPFKEEGAID